MFKRRPMVERQPIGQLRFDGQAWLTETPPPPVDSAGRLYFTANNEGPSDEQIGTFASLASRYGELLPTINLKLFDEYGPIQESYDLLPVTAATNMSGVIRLVWISVEQNCTAILGYEIYSYHRALQALERQEHQFVVTLHGAEVVNVAFEG